MRYLRPARIFNLTQNTLLAKKVILADTPPKRMIGLLGKTGLKEKEALVILPCKQVHTFFMRFSIDILFLDKGNKVIVALSNFKPYRITPLYFSALLAVELPAGIIESSRTVVGDRIESFQKFCPADKENAFLKGQNSLEPALDKCYTLNATEKKSGGVMCRSRGQGNQS